MARDVNAGAGQTRKGVGPATATDADPPAAASEESVELSNSEHPQALDDKTNIAPAPIRPAQNASVFVEELRVSDLVPLDSVSAPDERSADSASGEPPEALSSEESKIARRPSHRDFVDLPEGSLVGEYEIERLIGQGGMGAVYSAVHPILGRRVAIKIIGEEISRDAGAIGRFRREARAVAQLVSPHIVGVFGFGEIADGRAYFVMEHLTGESLRDRLARGRVPLDEALELLDQVARGLEVAHEAGIVHRDLKPENIFIERRRNSPPVVKLLDFGIVKLAKNDDDVTKTQAGVLIGTPVYVAPEQIKEAGSVDHRADIYALGGVAFEVILGRVPFDRTTVVELIAAHLECAPPQPRTLWPEIPIALDALLFAMLAKDPAKRPTLGYVQETIEKVRRSAFARTGLAGASLAAPIEAPPVMTPLAVSSRPAPAVPFAANSSPPRTMPIPNDRRRRYVVAIASAVGVAVLAIVFAVTRGTDDADSSATSRSTVVADDASVRVALGTAPLDRPDAAIAPHAVTATPIAKPDATATHVVSAPIATAAAANPRTANIATNSTASPAPTPSTLPPPPSTHPTSDTPPPPPTTGELAISSKPPCEVLIDEKPTGHHTPLVGVMLEPGIHTVTLVNDKLGIHDTTRVQILPGKPARVIKDYSGRVNAVDPNGTIDPFGKGSAHQ